MPVLNELPEIAVRALAYELLVGPQQKGKHLKRLREVADFYLLRRYGDASRGIKAQLSIAALARRVSRDEQTCRRWMVEAVSVIVPEERRRLKLSLPVDTHRPEESRLDFRVTLQAGQEARMTTVHVEKAVVLGQEYALVSSANWQK